MESSEPNTARACGGGTPASPFDALTLRECEVATGLIRGLTNKQIGFELGISHRTVEIHRARLMRKLGAPTLAALLATVLPQRARIERVDAAAPHAAAPPVSRRRSGST